MADIQKIIPFTYKWEGGLTDNPKDSASKTPAPWPYTNPANKRTSSKWHTNKGITYATFSTNAKTLGYQNTAANFFTMPADIWLKIAKNKYWDILKLDTVTSQAVANIMFSWIWGSGYAWRPRMQRYLLTKGISWNINDFTALAASLNILIKKDEKKTFEELLDQKKQYLESLADFKVFGPGWINRLNDLRTQSVSYIKAVATSSVGLTLFFLAAAAGTAYYFKDDIKKLINKKK